MRKLYLFTKGGDGYDYFESCYAVADDGVTLAGHLCSNVKFMRGDLYELRAKEPFEKHFGGKEGEAFEIIELRPGELPPEDVLKKSETAPASPDYEGAEIQVELEDDNGETKTISKKQLPFNH